MNAATVIDSSEIRARAYARWQRRGCPAGAPEVDWLEAEQELFDEQWDVQASSAPLVTTIEAPTARALPQRPKATRKLAVRTARIASVVAAADASAEAAPPASAPRSVRRRAAAASR